MASNGRVRIGVPSAVVGVVFVLTILFLGTPLWGANTIYVSQISRLELQHTSTDDSKLPWQRFMHSLGEPSRNGELFTELRVLSTKSW